MAAHVALGALQRLLPRQRSSHAALSCIGTGSAVNRSAHTGTVDAVIVPASRGAEALDGAVGLAARSRAPLIALCSKGTLGDEVVARFARTRGSHVVAVDLPPQYRHDLMPTETDTARFRLASGNRKTDLSLKRNIGLLLARLNEWGKILFLDDDIGDTQTERPAALPAGAVNRLVTALDAHQIAGLACRQFPDNSVVCHARRLAGFDQDTFISGAALGVNCNDHPLPFFPNQYNEDWFFFSRRVAARDIARVGDAVQAVYDPFETPERARHEEFGDLLAEGLFTWFAEQPDDISYLCKLKAADTVYWDQFMAERRDALSLTGLALEGALEERPVEADRIEAATLCLDAAADQLSRLSPELCVDYLDAWATDLVGWEQATQRIRGVGSIAEAMAFLGLTHWSVSDDPARATAATWT